MGMWFILFTKPETLPGKLLALCSHDSRGVGGGDDELIVSENIEYRTIRTIFGPTR